MKFSTAKKEFLLDCPEAEDVLSRVWSVDELTNQIWNHTARFCDGSHASWNHVKSRVPLWWTSFDNECSASINNYSCAHNTRLSFLIGLAWLYTWNTFEQADEYDGLHDTTLCWPENIRFLDTSWENGVFWAHCQLENAIHNGNGVLREAQEDYARMQNIIIQEVLCSLRVKSILMGSSN